MYYLHNESVACVKEPSFLSRIVMWISLSNYPMGVEEMAAGFATFQNGLTLEISDANASNLEDVSQNSITGTLGALHFSMPDAFGGDWSMGVPPFGLLPEVLQPTLKFTGHNDLGFAVTIDYRPRISRI